MFVFGKSEVMSANGETSAVMKGIKHGACDYLLKPVRMEELRNIWQHVVRKKWRNTGPSCTIEDERVKQVSEDGDHNQLANEGTDGSWKQSKKRKDVKEEDEDLDLDNEDPSTTKKPRVVWSVDLHQQFVGAVNQLGIDSK
jgi:two-component response regulator (ARR-B family)